MTTQAPEETQFAHPDNPSIETVIIPRARDLGSFEVRRAVPSKEKQMIGPFVFFDQVGPGEFITGEGVDVRPHPHIGLATVTYLFEGEIGHRDSLGYEQTIRPGDVNWMTAGKGIVHSERTPKELRAKGSKLFGNQLWVALPKELEETDPEFIHTGKKELPIITDNDKTVRLVTGSIYGETSPVKTFTDMIYVDYDLQQGAKVPIPIDYEERGIYVFGGEIEIASDRFEAGRLLILRPGDEITITAVRQSRIVLLGGEPMDGPRYLWWNFVTSSKERMEQAKHDWKAGHFDKIVGETEFIPLPEE